MSFHRLACRSRCRRNASGRLTAAGESVCSPRFVARRAALYAAIRSAVMSVIGVSAPKCALMLGLPLELADRPPA
jgi:hypothetical protein